MYLLNKFIKFNRIHKLFRSLTTKAHDESSFFITAPIFYVNGGNSDSSFSNCNCNFVEFQILILVTCTL